MFLSILKIELSKIAWDCIKVCLLSPLVVFNDVHTVPVPTNVVVPMRLSSRVTAWSDQPWQNS